MDSYFAGQLVRVACYTGSIISPTGGFRDAVGDLTDPTVVTLRYQPGEQAAIASITYPDPQIVRDGPGLYHCDLDTTGSSGAWTYEWVGTGTVQATASSAFVVRSPFA